MKHIALALIALVLATTAYAAKPQKRVPGPTFFYVDSNGSVIGPGDYAYQEYGYAFVETPTGEWAQIRVRRDELVVFGSAYYVDDVCGGLPYVRSEPTDMLALTGVGATGSLYGPLLMPVESLTFYSYYSPSSGCNSPWPDGYTANARSAEPLPLPFSPPFRFEVR